MSINDELLDELLKEYRNPEDLIGKNGILKQLTKRLAEKAMESELTHHLGYAKNSSTVKNTGNSRNGKSPKNITGNFGEIPIEVPQDRNGEFIGSMPGWVTKVKWSLPNCLKRLELHRCSNRSAAETNSLRVLAGLYLSMNCRLAPQNTPVRKQNAWIYDTY